MSPRSGNRPSNGAARLLAALAVLALLAALLLTAFLDRTLPGLGDPAGKASNGLVLLIEDREAPRLANRILAAGLAEMGIGLAILPEPDLTGSGRLADAGRLAGEAARLQSESGLEPGRVIYAANAGAIPALLDLVARPAGPAGQTGQAGLAGSGGLILILPDAASPIDPSRLAALPEALPVAIVAAAHPAAAEQAAGLFLWLTGEDSALFPGLQGRQPLAAQTWLSVDGNRRLALLPALSPLNSGWSPRLHQAVVQAAATALATAPADPAEVTARLPRAASAIAGRTLMALLALLLWAAVPLLLILAKSVWTASPQWLADDSGRLTQHAEPARRLPPLLEIPLYLPAALLALPAGRLLARLAGDSRLVLGFQFYALLGIYGWLYLLATWGRRHVPAGEPPVADAERRTAAGVLRKWVPTVGSALAAIALLLAAVYWLQATAGQPVPSMRLLPALLALVPLRLLMLPALLPFAYGYLHPVQGMARVTAALHGLAPALFLFALRLAEHPDDLAGALLATASGMILLFAARSVARSLSATVVRAFVPALAGLMVLLLFRPFPVF